MVFSSLIFIFFFLPVSLISYYLIPRKYVALQNIVFLLSSLFFYFYGEPKLIWIMVLSILMNYIFGLLMNNKYKKAYLVICVIFNLGLLGFFKYFNFFIDITNSLVNTDFNFINVIMPIGISFFTFQSMSYVIDVYREEAIIQKNILNLALYISMFPQLIAGPIVRYKDVNKMFFNRNYSSQEFSYGIDRFIYGLSKKILLSNVFASIADFTFNSDLNSISFSLAWFGAIAYTLQIYFDFSGYSDMAIGLGRMFGFKFLENFNYPYISKSITEFWRRWHISLSTWFRDYIYIPLGGSRCSFARHILNIFIVWILTGFWHGASFNFILWGLFYAIILTIEKLFLFKYLKRFPSLVAHIYTLILVIVGWVLFRSENLTFAFEYLKIMFTPVLVIDNKVIEYCMTYYLEIFFGLLFSMPIYSIVKSKIKINTKIISVIETFILFTLLALCVVSLVNNSYNPFIYFRF